jgi:hypothetical protein
MNEYEEIFAQWGREFHAIYQLESLQIDSCPHSGMNYVRAKSPELPYFVYMLYYRLEENGAFVLNGNLDQVVHLDTAEKFITKLKEKTKWFEDIILKERQCYL